MRIAQAAQEAERKKQAETETGSTERKKDSGARDSADSETETESFAGSKKVPTSSAVATGSESASARLQPIERDTKKRPSTGGDSSGYGSTDSEWEKVDDNKA